MYRIIHIFPNLFRISAGNPCKKYFTVDFYQEPLYIKIWLIIWFLFFLTFSPFFCFLIKLSTFKSTHFTLSLIKMAILIFTTCTKILFYFISLHSLLGAENPFIKRSSHNKTSYNSRFFTFCSNSFI